MNEQKFYDFLNNHDIHLNDRQKKQFQTYFETLVLWNQKMNLTSLTDKQEVYEKHFFDSIAPTFYIDFTNKNVCDVGAGAGFPSLPILIANPHFNLTIVDSLKKRIHFLQALVDELALENVTLIHGRAEDLGQQKAYREKYDIVTARAVANLAVLAEFCMPFCKVEGEFIAWKASKAHEEKTQARHALKVLGQAKTSTETLQLPLSQEERNILFIKKTQRTPQKYPRKAGTPAKKPL